MFLSNTVFRELLQNSDDAGSRSVEIRFETKMHLSGDKGVNLQSDKYDQSLPDLKTAVACGFLSIHLILLLLILYDSSYRSTDGRSRITACYSETRIGIDSRRLVIRNSLFSCRLLIFS
jgi:hypothetical protein